MIEFIREFIHPSVGSGEVKKGGMCCLISVTQLESEGDPNIFIGLTNPFKS